MYFLKKHHKKTILFLFSLAVLFFSFVSIKFITRSYNDYIYGKFDLGNINQMLYNSARGDFLILTDEFGNNVSRFAMSHVDPSLLILVPFNLLYSDASFLLYVLVISFAVSSVLIYLIAKNEGLNNLHASLIGILVFLFPISGYILIWTGFRPLTLAMPFLLFAYYLLQRLDKKRPIFNYSVSLILAYVSFLIVILSKEELGIVLLFLLPHLYFKFKRLRKHIFIITLSGFLWSVFSFLYLIPYYSKVTFESLKEFLYYIDIENVSRYENLFSSNFFIHRYDQFGSSYTEIIRNIILNPSIFIATVFTKDILLTLLYLLVPVLFSVFFSPLLLLASLPEILIHSLTGDIEYFSIENHRLYIVIPILLLSLIFAVKKIERFKVLRGIYLPTFFLFLSIILSIFLSINVKSPLIYPLYLRFSKMSGLVDAQENNDKVEWNYNLEPRCANFILDNIGDSQKISVPQSLGAKTSNKKFNALFPTGLDTAEVVVPDILERKVTDFLDLDVIYNKKALNRYLRENNIYLETACNRLLLVRKGMDSNYSYEVLGNDFSSTDVKTFLYKNEPFFDLYEFNYTKLGERKLELEYIYDFKINSGRQWYFAYTYITNGNNHWSFVHLPSYYLEAIENTVSGDTIKERFSLSIPDYVDLGEEYDVFFGIGNTSYTKNNIKIGTIRL